MFDKEAKMTTWYGHIIRMSTDKTAAKDVEVETALQKEERATTEGQNDEIGEAMCKRELNERDHEDKVSWKTGCGT